MVINLVKKACILFLAFTTLNACAQRDNSALNKTHTKMKVEIWSDVMCPFCYIGKRKFEEALSKFEMKDSIEIIWKSFQLDPELKTDASKSTIQHLSETKGWSIEQTKSTIKYVEDMAIDVGLHYDFNKVIIANSFDAHRLIQFAKKRSLGSEAEERLFKAYFIEGKNISDHDILKELADSIGLNSEEVSKMLSAHDLEIEVKSDIAEAQQIGVNGVPFFVINRKYAISGAQDSKVFLDSLNKAWAEH